MSEELNKFVIVQAVTSKSVHGCFVENVEFMACLITLVKHTSMHTKISLGLLERTS
jgi:hypothetical protein